LQAAKSVLVLNFGCKDTNLSAHNGYTIPQKLALQPFLIIFKLPILLITIYLPPCSSLRNPIAEKKKRKDRTALTVTVFPYLL